MHQTVFLSYTRTDREFALKLARDLRAANVSIWIDQIDIRAGDTWDRAVEDALQQSESILVILSPNAVASRPVMDEVSFALEENKRIFPVVYKDCKIPFRLRRVQYTDFTSDYSAGLSKLIHALGGRELSSFGDTKTRHLDHEDITRKNLRRALIISAIAGLLLAGAVAIKMVRWQANATGPAKKEKEEVKTAPLQSAPAQSPTPGRGVAVSPLGSLSIPVVPPEKAATPAKPTIRHADEIFERSYQFKGPFRISRTGDALSFNLTDAVRDARLANRKVHVDSVTFTGYVAGESSEPFGYDNEILIFPETVATRPKIAATDYGQFLELEKGYSYSRRLLQLTVKTDANREVSSKDPITWTVDVSDGSATTGELKFIRDSTVDMGDEGAFIQLFLWTLWGGEHFVEFSWVELRVKFRTHQES